MEQDATGRVAPWAGVDSVESRQHGPRRAVLAVCGECKSSRLWDPLGDVQGPLRRPGVCTLGLGGACGTWESLVMALTFGPAGGARALIGPRPARLDVHDACKPNAAAWTYTVAVDMSTNSARLDYMAHGHALLRFLVAGNARRPVCCYSVLLLLLLQHGAGRAAASSPRRPDASGDGSGSPRNDDMARKPSPRTCSDDGRGCQWAAAESFA